MLPGPGRFLLITLETIERNRQQPLSAGGAQPCVDFVKRARSCLHRHGIADPLHQPIIILRGPQRPASVGLSCKIAAEQIDEIQVGGMGERSATKPAQRQYGKLAARPAAMLRLELPDSRFSQSPPPPPSHPRKDMKPLP